MKRVKGETAIKQAPVKYADHSLKDGETFTISLKSSFQKSSESVEFKPITSTKPVEEAGDGEDEWTTFQ